MRAVGRDTNRRLSSEEHNGGYSLIDLVEGFEVRKMSSVEHFSKAVRTSGRVL